MADNYTRGDKTLSIKSLTIGHAEAAGIINNLHALLSRVSQPGQVLQLQKAIPPSLFDAADTGHLLAPPSELIKVVVCDAQRGQNATSQPIFLNQARLRQQTIPLRPISAPYSSIVPSFGYGSNVFIHRPVS